MHKLTSTGLMVLGVSLGIIIGSVTTTFASNVASAPRLPLYFAGEGWSAQMYVDEGKGYPALILKFEQGESPTVFSEIVPACPGTPDFMAGQFNGNVGDWKRADPVWLFAPDDKQEVELNIQFGSFWDVPEGQDFDFEAAPTANAQNPLVTTKRGYWVCASR